MLRRTSVVVFGRATLCVQIRGVVSKPGNLDMDDDHVECDGDDGHDL